MPLCGCVSVVIAVVIAISTQSLADLLVVIFTAKQLKASESLYVQDQETDALSGRVREIAKTALNLSESELQEFFDDGASVGYVVRVNELCWFWE